MAIFPVILCGGAGTRLWPASRPARPKQFIDLASDLSLFQETALRTAPLTHGGGRLLVVSGQAHRGFVDDQLAALGLEATILLEPEGRESAPAMAAAAAWIARAAPDGVALFVASDHHIPDAEAFRAAVREALPTAEAGRIVTFGIRPTGPATSYGYIRPEGPGLSPVAAFVEKPDRALAERHVRDGYLWNSGNFMVRASVLLEELEAFAPDVARVARAAAPQDAGRVVLLSDVFRTAPKISIDYAVMEHSRRISVLPVDYHWSDLGAWDSVADGGSGDRGVWIAADGDSGLVRAAEGMVVATAGVTNLAIIAERDAVLVCSLDRAQEVKGLVERLRDISPPHAKGRWEAGGTLAERARYFDSWMRLNALPMWAALGVDEDGGFREAIDLSGRPVGDFRRARVQTRQAYVYAVAGASGWAGPWRSLVSRGLERFEATNRRPDDLYRTRISADGAALDDSASLYDQAFALFAFAAAARAGIAPMMMSERAHALREALAVLRVPAGGWRETGDRPYQANAHMHLLEACMAWEGIEPGREWRAMADEIVALARRAFIDPAGGFLREFFDETWTPAAGEDGRLVEPGHQFEWAWLLTRWGRLRGEAWALEAAIRLYDIGARGVDQARGVAIDALNEDLSVRSDQARLWPQTERLKAALILAETAEGGRRILMVDDARKAMAGLQRYLEPSGLWRDKMRADGGFIDEPAPASSLYHIMVAYEQVRASAGAVPELGGSAEAGS
ncbi:AGE family epimerase/isomerase [Brevundimonas sp. Root1423]|uniref:AGE family epimerase/isomerase n=1 Tax=Brevundimonas sp. Root1423 TaxID=1736462 RepID=UPI0006F5886F|nr:AGE family epimerase/isomerase [Brevundimonas sp. Root1423]KQY84866.1 mannose-1-phosphate guanylyltransferase [Brevundimonas sp. Root1423]